MSPSICLSTGVAFLILLLVTLTGHETFARATIAGFFYVMSWAYHILTEHFISGAFTVTLGIISSSHAYI